MSANSISMSSYRSEPYDPYLPRGGSSSNPAGAGNAKTAAIQAQIDDTVGIMRENITKVAERGERLDQLQDKTGAYDHRLLGLWRRRGVVTAQVWLPPRLGRRVSELANWGRASFPPDNLAVSAQGFRRGANRVRKVRLHSLYARLTSTHRATPLCRTCGMFTSVSDYVSR